MHLRAERRQLTRFVNQVILIIGMISSLYTFGCDSSSPKEVRYSDSKLDAEEAGYDRRLGGYHASILAIASAILDDCKAARGRRSRDEGEPSPAQALARVEQHMDELAELADQDIFDVLATTIPPAAMTERHVSLLEFIMVERDGLIAILKDRSSVERAARRLVEASRRFKDTVELRPRREINTGEITVAFQPQGLPVGVGLGLESGEFTVSIGIPTPIGQFSVSGGGASTVELLEIRSRGRRRFFRLNRDFKVVTPEGIGSEIIMQDGGKTFIMHVKTPDDEPDPPKPKRRPKVKKIVYDEERHLALTRYHESVNAASFLSKEDRINWKVMGGGLTTEELVDAAQVVAREEERIQRERLDSRTAAEPTSSGARPSWELVEEAAKKPDAPERGGRLRELEGWVVRISSDKSLDDAMAIESHMQSAGFRTAIVEHDRYYCVVLGNYADELAVRDAAELAATHSPRGDRPRVHDLSAWCPHQRSMGNYIQCAEYSIRISSTRSLGEARAHRAAARQSGHDAYVTRDDEMYRVFVGWFVKASDAALHVEDAGAILGQGTVVTRLRKYCKNPMWEDGVMQCVGGQDGAW